MSADQTATIRLGEHEYLRLREAEEQLRLAELTAVEPDRSFSSQTERTLRRESNARLRAFNELTAAIEAEINQVEQQSERALQAQTAQLQRELSQARQALSEQTTAQIDRQMDQLLAKLSRQDQQLEQAWREQENLLQREEQRRQWYAAEARRWLETCDEWLVTIQRSYPHQNLAPGEMDRLLDDLRWAAQNYSQGLLDIALQGAHALFSNVRRFYLRLEKDWCQLQTLRQEAVAQAQSLLDHLDASRQVPAMDLEGSLLPETITVDPWTRGAFSALGAQTTHLLARLQSPAWLTLEDLNQILTVALPDQTRQAAGWISQARAAALDSQLRFNIAQIVVNALEEQGYIVQVSGYLNADFHNTYQLSFQNIAGNRVDVTIDPAKDENPLDAGGNRLNLIARDGLQMTEHELMRRNYEIFKTLSAFGLKVEDIHSRVDGESPALQNPLPVFSRQGQRHNPVGRRTDQ